MQRLIHRLQHQIPLDVLFINDVGFQYGAGIAHLRQIQSFLVMGHRVSAICCKNGEQEKQIPVMPWGARGEWLGMTEFPYLQNEVGLSATTIIEKLVFEVLARSPDVIILGNIHGAKWSIGLLAALKNLDILTIAYLHDCYYVTGRCAYPGTCEQYKTGCNESCPTANQYPVLPPELIFNEWLFRRQVFGGYDGIPLAVNSRWTLGIVQSGFKSLRNAECLYYGLDARLFSPIDKSLARRILGLPEDAFIILTGAVNVSEHRKGGHLLCEILDSLKSKATVLVFGAESTNLPGVIATGLLRDYRKMPLVYSASDLFVGTSLEEAFGQTFCEAAACGIPSVAFRVGGVPEIAQHGRNAVLAHEVSPNGLREAIEYCLQNPHRCQELGQAGRKLVEENFTLECQGQRWMNYMQSLAFQDFY